MKTNRTYTWSILAVVFALVLSSCGASTPNPTETPLQNTPTTPAMGRINGRVEFQGPPTPATVLYVVNLNDPSQWFTRELIRSDGPTPFEIEVPAGSYQVYARQADGPMAAAYLNPDNTLGSINVPAGQVVSEVLLKYAAPQTPCQITEIPASPDGHFAAITVANCSAAESAIAAPTTEALATIRGTVEYGQAPPTPTTIVYFVSAAHWYWLEVPGAFPVSTFEWQVAPGTYQLMAHRVGSEAGETRPSAYTDGVTNGIGYLTVAAGQVIDGIKLHNVNSDMCISVPFPASPDGRFPELKENCNKIPTDIPPTTNP